MTQNCLFSKQRPRKKPYGQIALKANKNAKY